MRDPEYVLPNILLETSLRQQSKKYTILFVDSGSDEVSTTIIASKVGNITNIKRVF